MSSLSLSSFGEVLSNNDKWLKLAAFAASVGVAGLAIYLLKKRYRGAFYKGNVQMDGKTVLITGANTGIGFAAAMELAKRKARVIMACRDTAKGLKAAREIRKQTPDGDLFVMHLDLASLQSVRKFVEEIQKEEQKIHVLINNAGIMGCPYEQTEDGFEMQMGVNHLGHFLLTNLLLDKLKSSAPSRVVIVSSALHKRAELDLENLNMTNENYKKRMAYSNSKLANNLFGRELAKRTEKDGIFVYCLHPGVVRTELGRHFGNAFLRGLFFTLAWPFLKNPHEGAQTTLYCALEESLEGRSGYYYGNCKEEPWSEICLDDGKAKKLWELSERLTGLA